MLMPKFEYGMAVRVIRTIRNDEHGVHYRKGQLLVRTGSVGYVRQSGVFQQDKIIYQVHFLDQNIIVGCRETELQTADSPWYAHKFERGDRVELCVALRCDGQQIAHRGDRLDIIAVDNDCEDIRYRVLIGEHDIWLPEKALSDQQEENCA